MPVTQGGGGDSVFFTPAYALELCELRKNVTFLTYTAVFQQHIGGSYFIPPPRNDFVQIISMLLRHSSRTKALYLF